MKGKFDFSVVAVGDRDPGPDRVPYKSRYLVFPAPLLQYEDTRVHLMPFLHQKWTLLNKQFSPLLR